MRLLMTTHHVAGLRFVGLLAVTGLPFLLAGCEEVARVLPTSSWHQKCGWEAEDYFEDPQVVALCEAIEANDVAEIDRLVAAGADVNAQGKGKRTPLLWAFPDNKLDRFRRLLEHGADPNVVIESDFNTHGGMSAGDSVTHMACRTAYSGYFEAVFDHGGDVNLQRKSRVGLHDTPLFSVIKFGGADKKKKIRTLLSKGADINHMNGAWLTPPMQAATWGGQYDIALLLLKAGADHGVYRPRSNSKLIHSVASEAIRRSATWSPQRERDYQQLVQWLEDHGESVDEARADIERWRSWSLTTGERRRKMDAEVAQRKARDAREKAARQEQEDVRTKP